MHILHSVLLIEANKTGLQVAILNYLRALKPKMGMTFLIYGTGGGGMGAGSNLMTRSEIIISHCFHAIPAKLMFGPKISLPKSWIDTSISRSQYAHHTPE